MPGEGVPHVINHGAQKGRQHQGGAAGAGAGGMPADLEYAAERAAQTHGTLRHDGLEAWLHGIGMGGYADGLSQLGMAQPWDVKKLRDEDLSGVGMRPAEQRKLRRIADKMKVQGSNPGNGILNGERKGEGGRAPRRHTDL